MAILSTPPTPRALGHLDGRDGGSFFGFRRGRWGLTRGLMEAFSFRFRAVGVGTLRFSHFGIFGVSDFRILEFSEFRIFAFWNSLSFGFSDFGVPGFALWVSVGVGIFGVSDFEILGFSDFGMFGFSEFRISDFGILVFSDVGLFGFSGMLDFQMFECFCFGLDDFAKIGKLKFLLRLRRALINLSAYLQKLQ